MWNHDTYSLPRASTPGCGGLFQVATALALAVLLGGCGPAETGLQTKLPASFRNGRRA